MTADRLTDPDDHFPYKLDEVKALLEANPPLGPDGPDDDRVRAEDYLSADIADASAAYVEAQAAFLTDPGDGTKAAYQGARDKLQAARAAHRANRPAGPVVIGIRARRAGE
jgi:hypothetical protein